MVTVALDTSDEMELDPTLQDPVVALKLTVRPVAADPVVSDVAEMLNGEAPYVLLESEPNEIVCGRVPLETVMVPVA